MKKNRLMNMPTRMWLLGSVIAVLLTYTIRTSFVERGSVVLGFVFICVICEVLIWVLFDSLLPTLRADENVWICEQCFESGVVVVSAGDTMYVLISKALLDHRSRTDLGDPSCEADEFDIDLYEEATYITSFPAWAHFQLRWELLKYRQLHQSLAK